MSTKGTLAGNFPDICEDNPHIYRVPPENRDKNCPKFHLYEEALDDDKAVYLELPSAEFEASQHGITLKIPAKVWNRIIKIGER